MEAWEYIQGIKGANEDNVVTETWMSSCGEIGGTRTEDEFLPADWAKVRDLVIKDLDLTVPAKAA